MNSITALILFYKRQLGTRGLNIAICGMRYCRMVIMYGYLENVQSPRHVSNPIH
jgi:hypothetical protein